jgi:hypothetical protein
MSAIFWIAAAAVWLACGAVIVTAAVRSRRDPSALRTARIGVGVLYLGGGATVNTLLLLLGEDYADFAEGSDLPFVRHTWHTLVVPNHETWISLLIAFEVAVGVLALLGQRRTQLAYAAAIGFHVALLSFGVGFYVWSLPMIAALARLLRGERLAERTAAPTAPTALDVTQAA